MLGVTFFQKDRPRIKRSLFSATLRGSLQLLGVGAGGGSRVQDESGY